MELLFFCSKNNDKVKQKVKIPEHCLWNLVSRYKEDNFQRVMCFLFFFLFFYLPWHPTTVKVGHQGQLQHVSLKVISFLPTKELSNSIRVLFVFMTTAYYWRQSHYVVLLSEWVSVTREYKQPLHPQQSLQSFAQYSLFLAFACFRTSLVVQHLVAISWNCF